jgi:hypothetical protein
MWKVRSEHLSGVSPAFTGTEICDDLLQPSYNPPQAIYINTEASRTSIREFKHSISISPTCRNKRISDILRTRQLASAPAAMFTDQARQS